LHNDVADTLLYRAFRSEEDWRVRVNILNAFARFPVLDSLNFITIVRAAYGARQDDPLSIHVGLTAQSVLEQIVRAGKVPKPLIPSVRAWLNGFGDPDAHPDIARIVLAAATPAATLLATPSDSDAIRNYGQANNVYEREYSVRAMGSTDNVDYFGNLLSTMTYVSPLEQLWRLEALDSLWQRAKREPAFRAKLEANHFANVYRYLLIRVSSVVDDPAVVTTALDHLRDSTILTDTLFRNEAGRYLLKYLHSFAEHAYRDQLLAAITAEVWMKADSKPLEKALTVVGDSAQHWRDNELMDSLYSAFGAIGVDHKAWVRLKRESHIDWNYLERLPDKMTINLDRGSIELRLLTDEAPLTVLNMVRLAKGQYFTNQRVHRVVPNFVIQSGDPTGTGWGGPGFTIRSEFTPHEYDHEGVVGMARDGKDTESSQWFITHCPTPNLDTRYTVWAEVTGGMRTVMSVQRGDKVQTVVSHK
jgi:cyclophilin family peptidyl-prolyl cis-trans isomerase